MKLLNRMDIDSRLWDERIAASSIENIFCYSWYLDAVAENWAGLVSDHYETILPVPFTSKLGVKRFYQAPFTREYDIFGADFLWDQALKILSEKMSHFSFRNREAGILEPMDERVNQELMLNGEHESAYRSNAKRLIKKGIQLFTFEIHNRPDVLIDLFQKTVAHKIEGIDEGSLVVLRKLMDASIEKGLGEMIVAKNDMGHIIAGAFFLKDKKRITYLKGAATDEAKKAGAMYALIHTAIERYSPNFNVLDFGGSDIENVATFYKKFGATDRKYYNYTLDKTPFWFKTLKKIKR